MPNAFTSILSMIIGAIIAMVTIFGLINSQVNSTASHTADVGKPAIDYGSTR